MSRYIRWWSSLVLVCALASGCAAQGRPSDSPAAQAQRDRLQRAEAIFQAHCKTAGEKIYKTVDNVEGIFLMKIRPERINFDDQYAMDDPYGLDSRGETYIKTFFSGFYQVPEVPPPNWKPHMGYHHVEAVDPKDGARYRYTGRTEEPWQTDKHYLKGYTRFVLDRVLASDAMPRYGVTYDDISTREDRDYWIAGSSLKVIDLQSNEVIAERVGYMMDYGQGNTSGGRSPWLIAAFHACPAFPNASGRDPVQSDQTRNFVAKVLKPAMSNK